MTQDKQGWLNLFPIQVYLSLNYETVSYYVMYFVIQSHTFWFWMSIPQEYNSPRFCRCDEWCAFGIAILLYIDKGVPVAHKPTKRSTSRQYFNRSPTSMTSFLFCFKTYLNKYAIYKHDKYLVCQSKHYRLKKKEENYNFSGFAFMYINVPICLRNLSKKIRFPCEMLWLSAGRLLTWVVGIRPEQASQTLVFSFCAHNRKGTLPFRLDTASTPTKWLFNFKAILCVNVWYGVKKNSFYCDPHARQVANNCLVELTAGLLDPGREDWDSFIYI